jgi:indole-3-glycerol phosphate synthase
VATYLDAILAAHREQAEADGRTLAWLVRQAKARSGVGDHPRDFAAALRGPGLSVIAEVKRRSPSKGPLAPDLVADIVAKGYADAGAAAISVLTDVAFFGGSPADLTAARAAVDVPVLRKDFTVSAADVADARSMGADAVLLIAAALDDAELRDFAQLTAELGMAALVEVHDEAEVDRALAAGATIIGVNQRDLTTFEVDTDRAVRVAASIPGGVVKVAESGIRGPADAARLAEAGYDAILVGEHLVVSEDPAATLAELVAACS